MTIKNNILVLVAAITICGTSLTATAQDSPATYNTGIGLRGGFTSGLSIKHFVSSNAAVEIVLGSRWHGLNVTGLYELHKRNALGINRLSWEYGLGARVGFYNGAYYREWNDDKYYKDRNYTAVSIVGLLGLEYAFGEIPFTIGLDIMPYFDVYHRGYNDYIDASVSFRYAF